MPRPFPSSQLLETVHFVQVPAWELHGPSGWSRKSGFSSCCWTLAWFWKVSINESAWQVSSVHELCWSAVLASSLSAVHLWTSVTARIQWNPFSLELQLPGISFKRGWCETLPLPHTLLRSGVSEAIFLSFRAGILLCRSWGQAGEGTSLLIQHLNVYRMHCPVQQTEWRPDPNNSIFQRWTGFSQGRRELATENSRIRNQGIDLVLDLKPRAFVACNNMVAREVSSSVPGTHASTNLAFRESGNTTVPFLPVLILPCLSPSDKW